MSRKKENPLRLFRESIYKNANKKSELRLLRESIFINANKKRGNKNV